MGPQSSTPGTRLVPDVDALLGQASRSPLGNTWSTSVVGTLNRSAVLNETLDSGELGGSFRDDWWSQLEQDRKTAGVGREGQYNQQVLHNEREAYYVELGGFDVHADILDGMRTLMAAADAALEDFEMEMKRQEVWENVTVLQASEFGRTVTSNGFGSDHGWDRNYWMAGGAVKSGQILGDYPTLGEESEVPEGQPGPGPGPPDHGLGKKKEKKTAVERHRRLVWGTRHRHGHRAARPSPLPRLVLLAQQSVRPRGHQQVADRAEP